MSLKYTEDMNILADVQILCTFMPKQDWDNLCEIIESIKPWKYFSFQITTTIISILIGLCAKMGFTEYEINQELINSWIIITVILFFIMFLVLFVLTSSLKSELNAIKTKKSEINKRILLLKGTEGSN